MSSAISIALAVAIGSSGAGSTPTATSDRSPGSGSSPSSTTQQQFKVVVPPDQVQAAPDEFTIRLSSDRAKAIAKRYRTKASLDIECTGTPESPHYSDTSAQGKGSVIGKVRVSCVGGAGVVKVYVQGKLGHVLGGKCSPNTVNAGPPANVWSGNTPVQNVTVNNPKRYTFYIPPKSHTVGWKSTRTWVVNSKMVAGGADDGWLQKRRFTGVNCP